MFVLEEIYKSKKSENSDQFNLRIQRSLSWLKKATQLDEDIDLKFISLWVSLNAAYAQEIGVTLDNQGFKLFLSEVLQSDQEQKIYHLVWDKLSQSMGRIIESSYTFQPFWDYQNKKMSQTAWKDAFEIEKKQIHQAVQSKDTLTLVFVVLNRLSTLKNQLQQGGSTYNSAMNRKQLYEGCTILSAILPTLLYILLENPNKFDLGKPFYPVQQMS